MSKKRKTKFCYYCGDPASTMDHKIPKSKGGGGGANLVPACLRCNQMKADLTDREFFFKILEITNFQILRRYD